MFSNSKIKDIVYHGTDEIFLKFDKKYINTKESTSFGKGFYFTTSENKAKNYAGNFGRSKNIIIMECLINIEHPLILNGLKSNFCSVIDNLFIINILNKYGYDLTKWRYFTNSDNGALFDYISNVIKPSNFTDILKSEGYDGIIIEQKYDTKEIVVFESEQIYIIK